MEADATVTATFGTSRVDNMCTAILTQRDVMQNLLQYVDQLTRQVESVHEEQGRQIRTLSEQVKALTTEVSTLKNMVHNLLHVEELVKD